MNNDLFNELLKSIREGGAILREEKIPSRMFKHTKPKNKRIGAGSKFSSQNSGGKKINEDEKKVDKQTRE